MSVQRVYVNGRQQVTIPCFQCGEVQIIETSTIRHFSVGVPMQCPCGAGFEVIFEKRSYYRKGTKLYGSFTRVDEPTEPQDMIIRNLSRSGIGVQVIEKETLREADVAPGITVGDFLDLQFRLDDTRRSLVQCRVTVQHVNQGYIGAKFHALGDHAKKMIGFYLMPV